MLSVSVGNINASLAFSATLSHSCMSLAFWNSNWRPYTGDSATVNYSVTTQSAESAFTTALAFYVCENIAWDVVLGRDNLDFCCSASGAFYKKKNNCVSHSHLRTFTVVYPFSSALYHIQDDVITYLNNFILLAQGNVSGTLNDRSHLNGNERRRMRVPQDYQDTSGCTLEAAATQCSLAESPRGPLLLMDMLLKKMHCGIRASLM